MNGKQSFFLTLCLGIVIGAGLTMHDAAEAKKAEPAVLDLPQNELQTFTEIYQRIKLHYVDDVAGKELIENAIRGMITGLDPHSSYLDTEEYKDLRIGTTGKFGGLGIEVTMEDGFVKVVSPIDDTPAKRAGMQAGDLIVRLDDKPVKGMTLSDAVDIMRGDPGEDITLTVVRQGENKPLSVTITRDIIKVQSVKNRVLEPGFGYIRITQFQARTTEDLQKAIAELKKKTKEVGLNGLVLDLRNNPGGLLTAAVGVSDAFLTEGGIVSIKGRNEEDKIVYNSESIIPGDMLDGIPVVVLINGGSASASEIVAGALQDHSRAVIIGTTSFGKGSVQTINELRQGNAVKLTTARYYTPNGRTIQAKGIEPDIKLSRVKVELLDDFGFKPVKESQLEGHLENDKEKQAEDKDKPLTPDELVKRDYQLYEALNLLKGLQVVQSIKK